jgi:hypothetical protein
LLNLSLELVHLLLALEARRDPAAAGAVLLDSQRSAEDDAAYHFGGARSWNHRNDSSKRGCAISGTIYSRKRAAFLQRLGSKHFLLTRVFQNVRPTQ